MGRSQPPPSAPSGHRLQQAAATPAASEGESGSGSRISRFDVFPLIACITRLGARLGGTLNSKCTCSGRTCPFSISMLFVRQISLSTPVKASLYKLETSTFHKMISPILLCFVNPLCSPPGEAYHYKQRISFLNKELNCE